MKNNYKRVHLNNNNCRNFNLEVKLCVFVEFGFFFKHRTKKITDSNSLLFDRVC